MSGPVLYCVVLCCLAGEPLNGKVYERKVQLTSSLRVCSTLVTCKLALQHVHYMAIISYTCTCSTCY